MWYQVRLRDPCSLYLHATFNDMFQASGSMTAMQAWLWRLLWLSALQAWALCTLSQACWRGWCPRCWFPPEVNPHHLQSRGILEFEHWSCRPAAASLPPGMVLEKRQKESSKTGQPLKIEMKHQTWKHWGLKNISSSVHIPVFTLTKQKPFPSLNLWGWSQPAVPPWVSGLPAAQN